MGAHGVGWGGRWNALAEPEAAYADARDVGGTAHDERVPAPDRLAKVSTDELVRGSSRRCTRSRRLRVWRSVAGDRVAAADEYGRARWAAGSPGGRDRGA